MQNPIKKVWYKRMWLYIVGGILLVLTIYLIVQGIRCSIAVKNGEGRLATYNATTANLSYGDMTYVYTIPDNGTADDKVILSMHGIFGGYDQAYDTVRDFASSYRILAPSRFGYLGSDVMGNGTPSEQAAAYVELLDSLGIDKVYPLPPLPEEQRQFVSHLIIPSAQRGLSYIVLPCHLLKSPKNIWNTQALLPFCAMTMPCF